MADNDKKDETKKPSLFEGLKDKVGGLTDGLKQKAKDVQGAGELAVKTAKFAKEPLDMENDVDLLETAYKQRNNKLAEQGTLMAVGQVPVVGGPAKQVLEALKPVKDAVEPVLKAAEPVVETLAPVAKQAAKVAAPVLEPVKAVVKPVAENIIKSGASQAMGASGSPNPLGSAIGALTGGSGLEAISKIFDNGGLKSILEQASKGLAGVTGGKETFANGVVPGAGMDKDVALATKGIADGIKAVSEAASKAIS